MSQNKFTKIDKNALCSSSNAMFSIYFPVSLDTDMECALKKGAKITPKDRELLKNKTTLYVDQNDKDEYKAYYANYLLSGKKTKHDEKSEVIYTKATSIIDDIYNNPETLGAHDKSKEVVSDLVNVILDDAFTIRSLMRIATHDYYTHTHSLNVSIYSLSLGSFIGLKEKELSELGEASLLHDLGKSKISPDIINKNGRLTPDEFKKMMKHPQIGFNIGVVMGIKNRKILNGIKFHHEKMDGSGYPSGLRGESIPLYARIVGLCDVFDALSSKRSYKEAMSTFEAMNLIKTRMNNHVDMNLLNEMIKMFK